MKMIIVDDDPLIKTAIRSMVDWDALGISIEGEASNGAEALELYLAIKPDIIVTDIKMPVMDGLTFIEQVKEYCCESAIVVLSCYDDFELVRKAFKLGAFDYILKPEMDEDKLATLFGNVIKSLNHIHDGGKQHADDAKIIQGSRRELLRDFFQTLIAGGNYTDAWVAEREKALHLRIKPMNLFMCSITVTEKTVAAQSDPNLLANSAISIIEAVLGEFKTGEAYIQSSHEFFIVLSLGDIKSQKNVRDTLLNICVVISNRLEKYMNLNPLITVSAFEANGYGSLPTLYRECLDARDQFALNGHEKILFYRKPYTKEGQPATDLACNLKKLQTMLETNQLAVGLKEIVQENKDSVLGEYSQVRYVFDAYASLIGEYVSKNVKDKKVSSLLSQYYDVLRASSTQDELNEWMKSICTEISRYQNVSNHLAVAARSYVLAHYQEPISLENAAEVLHVSKEHLSRVFAEKIGRGFMRYLMEVRAEKAKELIESGEYRIYEVAERVGYSSTEYFSKMFKAVTGMTPKEYQLAYLKK